MAGDLGGGAAEIEIDVIDMVLINEPPHRSTHYCWVGAVQLKGASGLLGAERGQLPGLLAILQQTPGIDHLTHEKAAAEALAQLSEGQIRDAGHGGEHHRRIDGDGSDTQRSDGHGTGGRSCGIGGGAHHDHGTHDR
ncbi:unannotated protein [freshwater metagenome]|uniref:Unannotated protein n=1 Tax=freshwater metagenome TaxID=449393 RepID=A0A6J7J212_9ZZZZ